MENIRFTQIYKENQDLHQELLPLWLDYMKEIGEHNSNSPYNNDEIIKDIQGLERRVKIQGNRKEMHFELFYCDDLLIGFANFAIDTGTVYGLIEAGYGVVMEFYIAPNYRRKGYGKILFGHIEKALKSDGTQHIYLTPDLVTGEAFWVAMGFRDTGKVDPDNKLPIYLKNILDNIE